VADIRELRSFISFHKQTALQTALVAADGWSLRQTNRTIGQPEFTTLPDKDDIGKGTPFSTQLYPVALSSSFPWEARLTSQNAAMLGVFGIGLNAKTAADTGFKYSCKPSVLLTASPNMPAATVVQAIRQGGSDVFDLGLVGMCLEEFTQTFNSGPGPDSASMRSQWVGCGKFVNPSTITIPTITTEHALNGGSATTVTFNGVNYLTNTRFFSFEWSYKNNIRLDAGYYLGSGQQNGFQLRGRMWRGDPVVTAKLTALFEDGSTELTDFLAQTEGTARVTLQGALLTGSVTHYNLLDIQWHRIVFKNFRLTDQDGLVSVEVDIECLEHSSNGVLTYDVQTLRDEIGTAA
jgi:hypothetical protein